MKATPRLAIGLLACVTVLGGCGREEPYEKPLRPVRVRGVERYSGNVGVRYSATINPYTQVNLAFKVDGYIREILQLRGADGRMRDLQEGDAIAKGTVLARVNETNYVEKVNQAKAQLAGAMASLQKGTDDFDRASKLFATKSITAPDYDTARKEFKEAQASVAGARAQLAEAKLNLHYCALTAPMDGVVLQRKIEVGALVGPGSVGFVLADLSSIKVVFGVPDVMLANLHLGSPLTVTTKSIRTAFKGRITAISPAANVQTRVFNIEITVPNPQNQLKVGMIASLQVPDGRVSQPVSVVPLSAIVRSPSDPAGYAVFVVEEQGGTAVARVRNVTLGEVYGNTIAVAEGVQVGERVIVTGAKLVRDGEHVRVIP